MQLPEKTDYTKWRLSDERGCHIWHYLEDDKQCKERPQSIAEKYHLGLPTNLPSLPASKRPLEAVNNGLSFFSQLQLSAGNWGCEYGGPLFLMAGIVVAWYVTGTPIPEAYNIEMRNYLFARQQNEGGWGLHIEGESTVFGTSMNYTVLRILGVDADHSRMIAARGCLHKLGSALKAPAWAKFWLAVLGVVDWDLVNPIPAELWLLPDFVPIAPWRWWIHQRQVFLPMSYIYSKRYVYPLNKLTRELRKELLDLPYESINFSAYRNAVCERDNYYPKTLILNSVTWLLANVWNPYLRTKRIARAAERWTYELIQKEDDFSDYADLAPVNAPLNTVARFIEEGPDSYAVRRHRERLTEFLWVKDEGMLANGTNGVQTWDTAFTIQAVVEAGLAQDEKWKPMLRRALDFLDDQQIRENCPEQEKYYRHPRKGAWPFSTRIQGYTVSDCTAEALKAVLQLQSLPQYPSLLSDTRLHDAVDILLTMQNPSGGLASYEPTRGSEMLEWLNAAEVFGRIMVEYDYPECTTATVTALQLFAQHHPHYRAPEIKAFVERAVAYIRRAQRADGSWFGSWGICFSYAGMFALEALAAIGESCANSERVRRACAFFTQRQMDDGGWGESYRSCEQGVWIDHEMSQVVQTAWVCIALMHAEYEDLEVVRRGLRLIMKRQQENGEWKQEAIEGVFNKSTMISYPNYKFIFPIKALGMYATMYGNEELL